MHKDLIRMLQILSKYNLETSTPRELIIEYRKPLKKSWANIPGTWSNEIRYLNFLIEKGFIKFKQDNFVTRILNLSQNLDQKIVLTPEGKNAIYEYEQQQIDRKWLNVRSWIGTIGTIVSTFLALISVLNQFFNWF